MVAQLGSGTCASGARRNPLELLRRERNPSQRSSLLLEVGASWSEHTSTYNPSEVETFISRELGVSEYNVMMLALGMTTNPPLCDYDTSAVRAAIRALKGANIDVSDIWFLVSKRPELLTLPDVLERWVAFLQVYGLKDRDLVNFLQRAPRRLLDGSSTLYQAGCVINFLRQLGIKNEYLAPRVLAVWPEVLCRDVEGELRPVVTFLMNLGVEVSDVAGMVCVWPELLLASVPEQLSPFVSYLEELGCSRTQAAEMFMIAPHLLGFKPADVFGHRVKSLEAIGATRQQLHAMVAKSTVWLTASGGVQAQIDFLLQQVGCTPPEALQLLCACPQIMAEKDFELERKWRYIQDTLGGSKALLLSCPLVLASSLMVVLGPRYSFLESRGRAIKGNWAPSTTPGCCPPPAAAEPASEPAPPAAAAGAEPGAAPQVDLGRLLTLDDAAWCEVVGLPLREFREHSVRFVTDYNDKITKDAAREFQDELKKLGIYEGTD